jgi:hypothetical protein
MQCGCITGIAAAVAAMSGLGLTGVASASTARPAANPNRGVREEFALVFLDNGSHILNYDLEAVNGHYLTAVGGGGRTTDVIHSDATQLLSWESSGSREATGERRLSLPPVRPGETGPAKGGTRWSTPRTTGRSLGAGAARPGGP